MQVQFMKQLVNNIKKFFLENYKWFIVLFCTITLLFLIENVMNKDITIIDQKGYAIISKYLISDKLNPIAKCITNFANMYWLIALTIILLVTIKNKKIAACIATNLGLSALVNFTIKQILQRPRPIENRIIEEGGYSFPSGHSMVSMAFYGFLIYLIYKYIKNKNLKIFLIILLSLLIIAIGISRIYLGVHYTSDVIAGFLVAIIYLIIYLKIIKNFIIKS